MNLIVDVALAALFVAVTLLGTHAVHDPVKGALPHELLAGILTVLAGIHVALHGRWIARRSRAIVTGTLRRAVLDVVLAILLALVFLTLLTTGLAISHLLGAGPRGATRAVVLTHHASSKVAIILSIWHVIRHRGWLARALGRSWRKGP